MLYMNRLVQLSNKKKRVGFHGIEVYNIVERDVKHINLQKDKQMRGKYR